MSESTNDAAGISGSLLRLGETRQIAIYQRDGVSWVADFRGGHGELFTAGEWFSLNRDAGALRRADGPVPLPDDVIERIRRLHRSKGSADMPAASATPAPAARHGCTWPIDHALFSRLGRAASVPG